MDTGRRGREPAKRCQDLAVWQRAHQFVLTVYKLTANIPKHEQYGLTSQLRRAAVSVPANIAEGFRRIPTICYMPYSPSWTRRG